MNVCRRARRHFTLPVFACLALASACAFGAQDTMLQLKPASDFDGWQVALKAVLIGAMGVAAAAGGLYAWRSWQRSKGVAFGDSAPAAVDWARRVTPRTTLLIVRWQGKQYLLAENAGQTALVDTRSVEEPAV